MTSGHRTYLNTGHKLITTRAVKPPVPRGHRKFIGKVGWR
jgi:hypothetical protein